VSRLARVLALTAATATATATALAAPGAAVRRCTAATTFSLYAIPSGYENGTKDVYLRGLPRTARHITLRFVRAADGRAVGKTAFPLQTWAASVKGFRSDGLLWVQISLAGYGYGMPVAKAARWRAVAAYDC
jgi:hypothetical protein